jgi:hypothetical protein
MGERKNAIQQLQQPKLQQQKQQQQEEEEESIRPVRVPSVRGGC